jgi:hypothetical protein
MLFTFSYKFFLLYITSITFYYYHKKKYLKYEGKGLPNNFCFRKIRMINVIYRCTKFWFFGREKWRKEWLILKERRNKKREGCLTGSLFFLLVKHRIFAVKAKKIVIIYLAIYMLFSVMLLKCEEHVIIDILLFLERYWNLTWLINFFVNVDCGLTCLYNNSDIQRRILRYGEEEVKVKATS